MIHQNSHDFPEIKLNSSEIYFSGSEDSPEKMTIIATKYGLEFNFDMLYKAAFDNCMANETCAETVPKLITIANKMSNGRAPDDQGLDLQEKKEFEAKWLEKALYDETYQRLYRRIF